MRNAHQTFFGCNNGHYPYIVVEYLACSCTSSSEFRGTSRGFRSLTIHRCISLRGSRPFRYAAGIKRGRLHSLNALYRCKHIYLATYVFFVAVLSAETGSSSSNNSNSSSQPQRFPTMSAARLRHEQTHKKTQTIG